MALIQNKTEINYLAPLAEAAQTAFKSDGANASCCTVSNVAQGTLKGLVITGCIAGACTFIGVAKKYAGDNDALYFSTAIASVITFTVLDIWAYAKWKNISNTPPLKLLYNEKTCCSKSLFGALKVTTLVAGLIAQIPLAYVAYTDNNNNFLDFSLLLFAASSIPALSLLLASSKIPRCMDSFEKKLVSSQKALSELLNKKTFHFLSKPKHEQLALLNKIVKSGNQIEGQKEILRELFTPCESALAPSRIRRYGGEAAKVVGAISGAARLLLFGSLGYHFGTLLSEEHPMALGVTVASTIVASTAYITFDVLTGMAKRTYDSAINLLQCKMAPSLAKVLHPYLSLIKIPPSIALATLTLLPLLPLPPQYLPECFPDEVDLADQIGLGIGTFLLYTNALNDLGDTLLCKPSWTDEEGKQLIKLYSGLKILDETIKKSSLLNIALFLQILPPEVFNAATKSIDISKDQIKAYLDEKMPPVELDETMHLLENNH